MGCYGIGPSRIMGTLVEVFHDKNGIIWPAEVAPFRIHLLALSGKNGNKAKEAADKIYNDLADRHIEVLYDDREEMSAGERFAEADLIGCTVRAVLSDKTLQKNCVELKRRDSKECELVEFDKIVKWLND